ncbi:hypothetical protein WME90_43660 [Sorangium sp. So ce375]|uniref:hypothetical protein n=1 Tax=Sorangium sp. So ce375 TaxID=3133306 RepID=UPI003F5B15B3
MRVSEPGQRAAMDSALVGSYNSSEAERDRPPSAEQATQRRGGYAREATRWIRESEAELTKNDEYRQAFDKFDKGDRAPLEALEKRLLRDAARQFMPELLDYLDSDNIAVSIKQGLHCNKARNVKYEAEREPHQTITITALGGIKGCTFHVVYTISKGAITPTRIDQTTVSARDLASKVEPDLKFRQRDRAGLDVDAAMKLDYRNLGSVTNNVGVLKELIGTLWANEDEGRLRILQQRLVEMGNHDFAEDIEALLD